MNREILFRGRRFDTKEWICGSLLEDDIIVTKGATDVDEDYIGFHDEWSSVLPETVGQFTGLTDKNGKKIFEGDILKWDEKEWGCPFFETVTWNYELFEIRQREWKSFCEVVGNIFDNPELLEENNT